MDYAQALRARCSEWRRKAQDQRQLQEQVRHDIEVCDHEASELRSEALALQLKAQEQREAAKFQRGTAQRDAKRSLRKEAEHREHQIKILKDDLVKHEAETSKLVEIALSEALQAASTRELHLELQWKAEWENDLRTLRDMEAESRRLQKDLKELEDQLQRFPFRCGLIQLAAVLDDLQFNKKAKEQHRANQQMQTELLKSWDRRVDEHQHHLSAVDADAAQSRLEMAERSRLQEEEAAQEEKELRERLVRNKRRADRAEHELSKYKATEAPKDGLEGCHVPGLPAVQRSALSKDFGSVMGALKALDQEGHDRFGLLRR